MADTINSDRIYELLDKLDNYALLHGSVGGLPLFHEKNKKNMVNIVYNWLVEQKFIISKDVYKEYCFIIEEENSELCYRNWSIYITKVDKYDKTGYLEYDYDIEIIPKFLSEVMENTFEINDGRSIEDTKKTLLDLGFQERLIKW